MIEAINVPVKNMDIRPPTFSAFGGAPFVMIL